MTPHSINEKNNFIHGWYTNKNNCKNLIEYFENNIDKTHKGSINRNNKIIIDKSYKASTDLTCNVNNNNDALQKYLTENLKPCVDAYINVYKYSSDLHHAWSICPEFNIQKYLPNEGFKAYHFERDLPTAKRHLVFTTYLNNVEDDGETEFYYQKTKIKPEQGLTVIFPADWTFTHRGVVSKTQTKYIITGWFGYN